MPKRILVIDSDRPFAHQMASALQARGVETRICDDGQQGLEQARIEPPDLIVLCVELPNVSGYSVCNKLKKDEQLKAIPLVITSAEATAQTFEQHRKLRTRAEDYLLKPFDAAKLLATVGGLIDLGPEPVGAHSGAIALDAGIAPGSSGRGALDDDDMQLIDRVFDELASGGEPGALENVNGAPAAPPATVVSRVDAPAAGAPGQARAEVEQLRARVAELVAEVARVSEQLRTVQDERSRLLRTEEQLRQATEAARSAADRATAAEGRALAAEHRLRHDEALRVKARKALSLVLQVLEDPPQPPDPGEVSPRRE
jgi:CheY-like chemotaxis protein